MRKPASIAGATRQSAALLAALLPLFHSAPARAEPVTTVEHVAALSLFSVADDALAPAATVRFASGYALSPRLTLQATAALGTAFVPGTQYHPLTTGRTSVDVLEASFGFRVLRTFQVRAPIVPWVSGESGRAFGPLVAVPAPSIVLSSPPSMPSSASSASTTATRPSTLATSSKPAPL
jgi:hypothetical protein